MFINITKRKNKKGSYDYYIYECESKRIEGKPKTIKTYVNSFSEEVLSSYKAYKEFLSGYKGITLSKYALEPKLEQELIKLWNREDKLEEKADRWFMEKALYEREEQNRRESFSDYLYSKSKTENIDLEQELIKAGYKALSKKYHPDITKDNGELMQELNSLYERLIK